MGPTLSLVLSKNCRLACPPLPVLTVSLACTPALALSCPATLPRASGFTLVAVPILCWAFAGEGKTRDQADSRHNQKFKHGDSLVDDPDFP